MNIQDETFPDDGLFNAFERSIGKDEFYKFQYRYPNPPMSWRGNASVKQGNLSTESSANVSKCPSSQTSSSSRIAKPANDRSTSKTIDSVDDKSAERRRRELMMSCSIHDIHNKYTKRRYRHVQSKVGQYIASFQAAERQRQQEREQQLEKEKERELERQRQRQKSSTMPISFMAPTKHVYPPPQSVNIEQRLSSDKAAPNTDHTDCVDKLTYVQLMEEKKHIGMQLQAMTIENIRLRRHIEYMRFELSDCQEKLKFMSINRNLSQGYNPLGCYTSLSGRCSISGFEEYIALNPFYQTLMYTKSTQTDGRPKGQPQMSYINQMQ